MKLYGYYRSSTSYRLRIALNLKGLEYDNILVNLLKGEQKADDFKAKNPFATVPMLEADGRDRAQSMAILEWLDEAYPDRPLLQADTEDRFTARELTYAIATELHSPLNMPVLGYLKTVFGQPQAAVDLWYRHWLAKTLQPLELRLAQLGTGNFLFDAPGMFEAVLIPQLYNARRFEFDLTDMPHIVQIEQACLPLEPFQRAHPDNQPDTPKHSA